ncbi:MAG: hypothetical protein K2N18_00345 [Clostridia bacterium]|nr:hypothetical protein [Clostridia bacterium]
MKKVKFVVCVLTLVCCLLCIFTSCNNSNGQSAVDNNSGQHYEIALNLNNFEEFFKVVITEGAKVTSYNSTSHDLYEITGVLNYAYYKDVYITFHAEYKNNGLTYQGNFTRKLNASGSISFYTNDSDILEEIGCSGYSAHASKKITPISVTGTVIFNI